MRFTALSAIVALLLAAWYYGWHFGAVQLSKRADAALAEGSRSGVEIDCANRRVEGFPFRVGIFCDRTVIYLSADGSRTEAGPFRSAAQFYDPGKVVAELDGPARIETPGSIPYIVNWTSLRASTRSNSNGPTAFSLAVQGLKVNDGWAESSPPLASAASAEFHGRLSPESTDNLDIAFSGASLRPAGSHVPPFAVKVDLRLTGVTAHLAGGFDISEFIRANTLSGRISDFSVEPEIGGILQIRGPFNIGSDGRVDARLTFDADNTAALIEFLGQVMPGEREILSTLGTVLALFSERGGAIRNVPMTIENGTVEIGPITVGEIPPLILD